MRILGIHDGHSASAAMIKDGLVLAAVQEERLSRHKNQGGFPELAIKDVLDMTGSTPNDIDIVAFSGYGKSNVKTREDIMASFLRKIEPKQKGVLKKAGYMLRVFTPMNKSKEEKKKQRQMKRMEPLVDMGFSAKGVTFVEHHLCHAATAYYGQYNRKDSILVITVDAAGDALCATVNIGQAGKLKRIAQVPSSDSVAIIYSFFTYLMGFVPLEHEYKLMGLAPYAEQSDRTEEVYNYLNSLFYFPETNPLIWARRAGVADTFKIGPNLKNFMQYRRFDNIAGGLQKFVESFFLKWIGQIIKETGIKKLALSGGLFMNVKLNKLIMELTDVESLFVFPSCGDETNSLGAAWAAYSQVIEADKKYLPIPPLGPIYFARDFTKAEEEHAVNQYSFNKKIKKTTYDDIERECAKLISQGKVVARCKGRMEFGARALGNRSILANPGSWKAVKVINEMIKMRDFWMPFAPSMLVEHADRYIVNPKQIHTPYMIMAFDTKKDKLDAIVAATHPYDESCRPQVVEASWNPDYYRLIKTYMELTGEAVVLNTSLNLHGLPIAYSPEDALYVFDNSGLEYLALGNTLIEEIK